MLRHAPFSSIRCIMTSIPKQVPIPKNGVDYHGKIVLAPMVRSGECPSRLMALRYGADLVWGPETIDKALIGTTRQVHPESGTVSFTRFSSNGSTSSEQRESVIYRLDPKREGRRLIYQIGTANPQTAVEAAKLIAPDVAGIDVNAGCPKPFSTSGGMGAALLKTPDKLCAILEALVKDVGTPFEIGISVKIRILDAPAETEQLVRRLCGTGITGLTVHCRTTPMRPRERAIRNQLKMVARVCREAGVACVMNGDVTSRDEALKLISEFGCDGAMIATAAEDNPSVFRAEADGGKASWDVVTKEYVKLAMEVENRWGNTKYLLGQMIPGKQPAYKQMTTTKCYTDVIKVIAPDDEGLLKMAAAVDQSLEIGTFEKPKVSKTARKAAAKAAMAQDGGVLNKNVRNTAAGIKRNVKEAGFDMPPDIERESGPATVSENTSTLVV